MSNPNRSSLEKAWGPVKKEAAISVKVEYLSLGGFLDSYLNTLVESVVKQMPYDKIKVRDTGVIQILQNEILDNDYADEYAVVEIYFINNGDLVVLIKNQNGQNVESESYPLRKVKGTPIQKLAGVIADLVDHAIENG